MTYKLLALDLDGTLVGPDLVVSPRNLAALRAAQARGVHVTLATGRMFRATLPFAHALDIRVPLICYQGAMLADPVSQEILYHRPVPLPLAREVLELARERGWHAHAYVDDTMYAAAFTPEVGLYTSLNTHADPRYVDDLLEFLRHDPTKLVLVGDEVTTAHTVEELRRRFNGRLYVTRSYPFFAEVAHPACSKGNALRWLTAYLGVSRAETMAIGDALNDREMVRWAGLGIAMGDAVPELRDVADYVTATLAEDGVAQAVERFLP